MKKSIFAAFLICTVLSFYQNARAGHVFRDGRDFVSAEGRFTVTTPVGFEKFAFEKRPRKTDSGDLEINQYSADMDRGTCMMAFYDLPDSLFQTKTIRKML